MKAPQKPQETTGLREYPAIARKAHWKEAAEEQGCCFSRTQLGKSLCCEEVRIFLKPGCGEAVMAEDEDPPYVEKPL